jgi:hypothetical protein
MLIPTDIAERILVEIVLGKIPKQSDTPEEAAFREELTKECAEIKAQGYIVDIPHEINVHDGEADAVKGDEGSTLLPNDEVSLDEEISDETEESDPEIEGDAEADESNKQKAAADKQDKAKANMLGETDGGLGTGDGDKLDA